MKFSYSNDILRIKAIIEYLNASLLTMIHRMDDYSSQKTLSSWPDKPILAWSYYPNLCPEVEMGFRPEPTRFITPK